MKKKTSLILGRDGIVHLEWNILGRSLLMLHRALDEFFSEWDERDPSVLHGGPCEPIRMVATETAPGVWDYAGIEMRRQWLSSNGERVSVEIYEERHSSQLRIRFVVPGTLHTFVTELWPKMEEWMGQNHFLRAQKFSADYQFLKLPKTDVWKDLILPEGLKEIVRRNTIGLLEKREAYRRLGFPLKRGLLLYGPPGTGKTMIGRAVARECECTFILITSCMLQCGEDVANIFKLAQRLAPTILFFEDIDLVGADRHTSAQREVLGELLTGLDGLDSAEGVISIATTNDLASIEPALKDRPSRFDVVLQVPALDASCRGDFVTRWFSQRAINCEPLNGTLTRCGNLTGAQLQEVCYSACVIALDRDTGTARDQAPEILCADIEQAIANVTARKRPAVGFGD